MDTTIVTGFSAKGYDEYGKRFLSTFCEHNVHAIPLLIYTDGVASLDIDNCTQFQQGDICALACFLDKYENYPITHGKERFDWIGSNEKAKWSEKEIKAGYSYRYDAYKFCKMVLTMWKALRDVKTEYMIWLDGDTVVRKGLPANLAKRALPNGYDYAYLGREPKHTETGFLVFKVDTMWPIIDAWAAYYHDATFVKEKEWHSAYLFDRARENYPELKGFNLTPGGRGHVIHKCWVGTYLDHCKGNRKRTGRSPEARE